MRLKEFILASLLTAIVLVIELVAIATGEVMVIITILSALPLYLLSRVNFVTAVISYICIAALLVLINPHQCLFFVTTNGLLGVTLGLCDSKIKRRSVSVFSGATALFCGIVIAGLAVGFPINSLILAVIFPLSVLYTALFSFIAGKAYVKFQNIKKHHIT